MSSLPPVGPDHSFGELRVLTWAPFTYLSVGHAAPLADLDPLLDRLMAQLDAACDAASVRPLGPVVLRYGAQPERGDVWWLQAGYPVRPGTPAAPGTQVCDLPAFRCAAMLYSGSLAHMGELHSRLMDGIRAAGLAAGAEGREWYLYFEGDSSPNNVIMLQRGLG